MILRLSLSNYILGSTVRKAKHMQQHLKHVFEALICCVVVDEVDVYKPVNCNYYYMKDSHANGIFEVVNSHAAERSFKRCYSGSF